MVRLLIRRGFLMTAAAVCVFVFSMVPVGGGGTISAGIKVVVTVVTDPSDPNDLTYQWRSTDGQIKDRNAPSTEWTLPAGPGKHFAYVLVSNGKGGYTERRIAVITDNLSDRRPIPRPLMNLVPPRAERHIDVPFRTWLGGGIASYTLGGDGRFGQDGGVTSDFKVPLPTSDPDDKVPDIKLVATNILQESTTTSLSGDLVLRLFGPDPNDLLPKRLADFETHCFVKGILSSLPAPLDISPCLGIAAGGIPILDEAIDREANQTNRTDLVPTKSVAPMPGERITWVTGKVLLEGGSPVGQRMSFLESKAPRL
jgi:hypothetical protein